MNRYRVFGLAAAIILVMALFLTPHSALAYMDGKTVDVGPFIGYYTFDNKQNLESGLYYGFNFGFNFTKQIGLEVRLGEVLSKGTEGDKDDAKVQIGQLDALYHFTSISKMFVPYLAVGGGMINTSKQWAADYTVGQANGGLGAKLFLTDWVAIRADARYIRAFEKTARNNFAFTGGLNFQWGPPVEKAKEPEPTPVAAKCADGDQDGVCDVVDKCPGTPAGVPVDASGCCIDSDNDGVCDGIDQCPNTPAGAKVDDKGCPVKIKQKVTIFLRVTFDSGKSNVKKQFDGDLRRVADFMKTYIDTEAVIEGHTDSQGSAKSNQKLSQKRADAVRQYLIDKYDVVPHRLKAVGYGESRPIADNKKAEGRRKNRRVVAVVSAMAEK